MGMFEKMGFGKKEKSLSSSEKAAINQEVNSLENQMRQWQQMGGKDNVYADRILEAKRRVNELVRKLGM